MLSGGRDVFAFVPCHMVNNRREVGGSVQLNRLKALMVSFKDPLHAITVRVLSVTILGKTATQHKWCGNYTSSGILDRDNGTIGLDEIMIS